MSETPPGSWPGLGAEGESMAPGTGDDADQGSRDRDAMDTASGLTAALEGFSEQLKAVHDELKAMGKRLDREARLTRRLRHVVVALAISFALDITLTVLLTVVAGQAHTASAQAKATVAQLHATQIAACGTGNLLRAKQVQLWDHLVKVSPPPPHQTRQQAARYRQRIAIILAYVRRTFPQLDCKSLYHLPPPSTR